MSLSGEYLLGPDGIAYLADIQDSLPGITVAEIPGLEFRLSEVEWIRTYRINRTGYLKEFPLCEGPVTLHSFMGLDEDSLAIEIADSKVWLENTFSVPCPTYAYPYHQHTLRSMEILRDAGYLGGRNGIPLPMPFGSTLLGENGDEAWEKTWERCAIFELPLSINLSVLQEHPACELADSLAPYIARWKQNNTWVHVYTHTDDPEQTNTPIFDAEHLAALLDALLDDGSFWIAPAGEIAAHVRATLGPEDQSEMVWTSIATGIPERSEPWQGYEAAFTFSTDDGFDANLYSYAPVFLERGLSFTAYLNPAKIQDCYDWYMDQDEVQALVDLGIEIGSHGMLHLHGIQDEVCVLDGASFEIVSDGELKLRVYTEE